MEWDLWTKITCETIGCTKQRKMGHCVCEGCHKEWDAIGMPYGELFIFLQRRVKESIEVWK